MTGSKLDSVYRERNQLVAAMSKHYPSYIGKHDGDHWEAAWLIVYVDLPSGQVSWHIHASDLDLFDHLERREGAHWDGHNTEEKYERLASIPDLRNQVRVISDVKVNYLNLSQLKSRLGIEGSGDETN